MFHSLFNPKLIGGIAFGATCGTTCITLASDGCLTSSSGLSPSSALIMDCQEKNQHYQVFLTSSGTVKKDGTGIKLEIFDVTKNSGINLKGSEDEILGDQQRVLRPNRNKENGRISNIKFGNANSGIRLMVTSGGGNPQGISCKRLLIKISNERTRGSTINDNIANVKFSINDKNLNRQSGRRVCNVTFASSHNLEGVDEFKPKVTLCSSS